VEEDRGVAQFNPDPSYDHNLAERVVEYLQTRDVRIFPFTARFDDERRRAFVLDLRDGLADLTDSGSARKTSAVGFIMKDSRLHRIVREWAAAGGGWPRGTDPRNPSSSLVSLTTEEIGAGQPTDRRRRP
jgi:hypothetical protein